MTRFREIIDLWPSLGDLAADAGVSYGTAKQWKLRDSIPSAYWVAIVRAASGRSIDGVTLEELASIAATNTHQSPEPHEAA